MGAIKSQWYERGVALCDLVWLLSPGYSLCMLHYIVGLPGHCLDLGEAIPLLGSTNAKRPSFDVSIALCRLPSAVINDPDLPKQSFCVVGWIYLSH